MKCFVTLSQSPQVNERMTAVAEGLRRNAVVVESAVDQFDANADFVVTWGLARAKRFWRNGFAGPILIVEHGYIGDRWEWISLGWNGLNGRAKFPEAWDGNRFSRHFVKAPWRDRGTKNAVIMGQVRGDQSLGNHDIIAWYGQAAAALSERGWTPYFRQHPVELRNGYGPMDVPGAETLDGTLGDALLKADLAVTFNSNTGVDAILAGIPVHTADRGSMVFNLSSHDYTETRPDRSQRLNEIACCQWTLGEMRSGLSWEIVRSYMPQREAAA